MKNLTKIFMAVVAGIFAFACTTDSTEDLGVQVGNGENGTIVELSLSLEESRTQLGEKADGIYPVYWSEGDKISVNGVESSEAVIGSNPATASFAVNVTSEKLCVAYPAAAEGQVLFAEKQNHVIEGNTFASGVSTMYGVGTTVDGIKLNHLTGVLKIGVTGSAVLSKAQISTIDRAPIAGAFSIDFESGELEATATSKDVIEYSFGEAGLQLSSEAQYIHVAVPAGKYDELYITLYEQGNSGNIMYATVKAGDEKPLVAGNVREFKAPITYAANAQLYVIDSVEKLQAFKAAIEAEGGLTSDAILTEDIDMTGVEWTPIAGESYVNTLIGNGYAIKGLTAPLFATTSASFKGVHLEDVNITTNDRPTCGALACSITATDTISPKVENCSVSGTFTVNNETYTPAKGSVAYGALIGKLLGGVIDGCVNNATVDILKIINNTISTTIYCGGVVGMINVFTKSDKSAIYSDVYNSVNYGAVTLKSTVTNNAYLGGVVGCSGDDNLSPKILSCENYGVISADDGANTTGSLALAGIGGYATGIKGVALTEHNTNHALITVKGNATVSGELQMGGLFGNIRIPVNNSENKGLIHVEPTAKIATANVGGILGVGLLRTYNEVKQSFTILNCVNNGEVKFGGSNLTETATNATRIGGISGYTQGSVTSSINNGKITIYGTRNAKGTIGNEGNDYKNGSYVIAGIVGYKTEGKITDSQNHGDIEIAGTFKELHATNKTQWKIAGITCYLSTDLVNKNVADGEIIISGTIEGEANIGGLVAFHYGGLTTETSATNITIKKGAVLSGGAIIGGVVSWTFNNLSNLTYTGTITIEEGATIGTKCYIGGCVGAHIGTSATARTLKDFTNNGTVQNNGSLTAGGIIGGCIGHISAASDVAKAITASLDNMINNGTVEIGETATIGKPCHLGGCLGAHVGTAESARTLKNLTNSGTVQNNGTLTNGGFIGGCIGHISASEVEGAVTASISDATNDGTVSCGPTSVTTGTNLYVSGVACHAAVSTNLTNNGKITIDGSHTGGNNYFAGCIADGIGNATGLINNADIECPATAKFKVARIGGLVGYNSYKVSGTNLGCINYAATSTGTPCLGGIAYRGKIVDCVNGAEGDPTKGVINFNGAAGSAATSGSINFGGLVCDPYGSCSNSTNYAPINIGGSSSHTIYGGGISYGPVDEGETMTNCQNYGKITISTKAGIPGNADRKGADCFVGGFAYNTSTSKKTHTYVNCHNHGDIELAPEAEIAGAIRLGGMIGNIEDATAMLTLDGCSNTGDIKISGKCSLGESSNCIIAGCISSCTSSGGTIVIKNGLTNKGNITVDGENTRNYVSIGGIFGATGAGVTFDISGNIVNTGKLTFSGKSNTYIRMGGIVSVHSAKTLNATLINTGDIECTGSWATTNTNGAHIGGITATHAYPIVGAQYYGNIKAIGYTGVGMITGKLYAEGLEVKDCAMGGTICKETREETDAAENIEIIEVVETIDASNVHKFIYGAEVDASIATSNNVTVLTSAPSTEQPAPEPAPEETPEA